MVLFPGLRFCFSWKQCIWKKDSASVSSLWNEVFILGDDMLKALAVYDPWKLPINRICNLYHVFVLGNNLAFFKQYFTMFEKTDAISATVLAAVGFEVHCVIGDTYRTCWKWHLKNHISFSASSGKWEKGSEWEKKERNLLAQIPTSPRIKMSDLKIPSEPACLICYHSGL